MPRRLMWGWNREKYERTFLTLAQAITVGAAYVVVSPIPGLTSSFIAIFTSLLPFDIMVASPSPVVRLEEWKRLLTVLRPRLVSTAITLFKGVAVAAVMGILALLGLPYPVGAVLIAGLAYVWAVATPHVITPYAAILAGLALFERLLTVEMVATAHIVREIVSAVLLSGGGTFMALLAGWGVGLVTGSVTRVFLSRPYRSLRSAAYELPLEMRPFNEVLHVGTKSLVVSAVVEEGAPVAHRSLAESHLRERWKTTVLSVKRGEEEVVMPTGAFVLMPGDRLLLFTERDQSPHVYEQFKGSPGEGASVAGGGAAPAR